ncbi:PAP2 superfamily [Marinomonas fungiae]|uniref:PAP2 superfamily n=2 Tax=Marinomonas fungiae TaxID=1137284 RepID=A0A0K6II60_9GAMM|nr:PAP2 superfamily [Marinomonas fungiae]
MKFIIKSAFTPIQRDLMLYMIALTAVSYQLILYINFEKINLDLSLYRNSFIFGLISTFFLSSIFMYLYLIIKKERRPLKIYLGYSIIPIKHWNESLNFILLSVAVSIIFSVYTSVKYSIPDIVPFYLDPYLIEFDNFLFFGTPPWKITHYIFSTPIATGFINFLYNIWFFIIWIFLISFMCCVKHSQIRKQVILSFLLCWIINGNLAALLFSSAGPCFYSLAYGVEGPYTELMAILNQQNSFLLEQGSVFSVWALSLQDLLWQSYVNRVDGIGKGISALPSMHVSMTCLIAISIYSLNKKWGILAWIYALLIIIGSIHLAWHYAADGIVAILLTLTIWFSVKKLTTRKD